MLSDNKTRVLRNDTKILAQLTSTDPHNPLLIRLLLMLKTMPGVLSPKGQGPKIVKDDDLKEPCSSRQSRS